MVYMIHNAHLAEISFIIFAVEGDPNLFVVFAHDDWSFSLIWAKNDCIKADAELFEKINDPINIILNLLIALPTVDCYISFIVALGFQLLERVQAYGMLAFFCYYERIFRIYHFWTALDAASGVLDLFQLHF